MTVPEDLELERALHRAVATIPVDVDAGWHDLRRRTRRSPARLVVWVAAAAAILLAVLVPIRLLSSRDASLDVGGLPDSEQSTPGGADPGTSVDAGPTGVEPTAELGPTRPIRLVLDLPACADDGDLATWASTTVAGFGSAATADDFVTTTVADVLATTPMPTDADAACAVTLRAGEVLAYEVRDAGGGRLGRGASNAYPYSFVPPAVTGDQNLGSPISSGQSLTGALSRSDDVDLLLAVFAPGSGGSRLIAVEHKARTADDDLKVAGLLLLSSLTVDRLDGSSMALESMLRPATLPRGFRLCSPVVVTPSRSPGEIDSAIVYCDDSGREIRFVSITGDPGPSEAVFGGLGIDANILTPSEPGRRRIGFGPSTGLVVDVPADLDDADVREMLRSVQWLDRRIARPGGGSHDYRDRDLPPFIGDTLAQLGVAATPVVDPSAIGLPGYATFQITLDGNRTVTLHIYRSQLDGDQFGSLLPGPDSDASVETVAGIDVLTLSMATGSDPVALPHQALFRCGSLDWNLIDDAYGAGAPVVADLARDLVEGLARTLPC